jgi:hypothetical protein
LPLLQMQHVWTTTLNGRDGREADLIPRRHRRSASAVLTSYRFRVTELVLLAKCKCTRVSSLAPASNSMVGLFSTSTQVNDSRSAKLPHRLGVFHVSTLLPCSVSRYNRPVTVGAGFSPETGGCAMTTYVVLANWTDQGARSVKDSPRRLDAAKAALRALGGAASRGCAR